MSRDYTISCFSEVLSPITHMAGVAGNEAVIAREPVVTPRGIARVPFLSGNAIRHRMIREPGMLWLIDQYELAGKLSREQHNFLLNGGALTGGSSGEDTAKIAEWQRTWPLGRLLGGSLPTQILAGSLQVWRGTLVCEENRERLQGDLDCDDIPRLRSSQEFVSGYLYTRGDKSRSSGLCAAPTADDGKSGLMLFGGQSVLIGAAFAHGFTLTRTSEIELGALLWSLRLWAQAGGTIGGQAAKGHGRLSLSLVAPDFDPESMIGAYLEYAASVKGDAVKWFNDSFPVTKPGDAPKSKAKGKGKARPEEVAEPDREPEPSLFGSED